VGQRSNAEATSHHAKLNVGNIINFGRMRFRETGTGAFRGGASVRLPDISIFSNHNDGTITVEGGGGAHGLFAKTITNSGTITVADNTYFQLAPPGDSAEGHTGATIYNGGKLTIGKNSTVIVNSQFQNLPSGLVEGKDATLLVFGIFLSPDVSYRDKGGKVSPGVKRIPASRGPGGTVHPDELGLLTFDGGYEQSALGSLDIQIG
jgi:hypothetical protein